MAIKQEESHQCLYQDYSHQDYFTGKDPPRLNGRIEQLCPLNRNRATTFSYRITAPTAI
jgi:hypothetical protein